jgi:2-octaprenyl-6-methoxyphenol hydroxylase
MLPQVAAPFDVAIVGGGLVGASLAIALEPVGLRVLLVESVLPDAGVQPSFDDRTTALGNGTRRIFEALDLWRTIAPQAAPIRQIHVSDAGRFGFARLVAAEQAIDAFGHVVANRVLGAALRERLTTLRQTTLRVPARASALRIGAESVELDLEQLGPAGPAALETVRARLVVAADGARSVVRTAAGLGAEVEDYGQVALVAHVASNQRCDGTAFERFTPTGPLAVLPLFDGSLGVVWTLAPAEAQRVMQLPDAEYLAELQRCFGWRAGRFERVGRRNAYPLQLTRATATVAARAVLIGNAAQALHPVAGQGFNLGLRDAATLAEVLSAAHAQPGFDAGAPALLEQFAALRRADREGVTRFTDSLVRLFADERPGLGALRNLGLLLFDLSPTAKSAMARVSWGFGGRMPRLARGLGLGT